MNEDNRLKSRSGTNEELIRFIIAEIIALKEDIDGLRDDVIMNKSKIGFIIKFIEDMKK